MRVCGRVSQGSQILTGLQDRPHLTKSKSSLSAAPVPTSCLSGSKRYSSEVIHTPSEGVLQHDRTALCYNQDSHKTVNLCPPSSLGDRTSLIRINYFFFVYSVGGIGDKPSITHELGGCKSIRAGTSPHLTLTLSDFIKVKPKVW